jgi:hypothetical protein
MKDGSKYYGKRSDAPLIGSEQVMTKFRSNTKTVLTSYKLEELIATTLNLEKLDDVVKLVGHCIADKS